ARSAGPDPSEGAEHHLAMLQVLWAHRHLLGTGELGARTVPYFIATEVAVPLLKAWAIVGTALGVIVGWFPLPDLVLVVLMVSLGHALVSNAALLVRGSAPDAPSGAELTRLLVAAPLELLVQGP